MGDFEKMLHGMVDEAVLNLHTALPCIVLSFDEMTLTCDLQPAFKQVKPDGTVITLEPVQKAVCVRHRFLIGGEEQEFIPIYKPGDIVLAVISERGYDHALSGQVADPSFSRHHALQDAIVVGRLSA